MTPIKCSRCKQVKPPSAFYYRRNGQALGQCKTCHNRRNVSGGQNMHNAGQIYAAEYDASPLPKPQPIPYGILVDRILSVMSPTDLDAWISAHARPDDTRPTYTRTASTKGRGQTSRLTWDEIEYIRNHADTMSRIELGAMFHITPQHAGNIASGRRGRKPAGVVVQ